METSKLGNRELNSSWVMVQRKAIPERHELTEVGLVLHDAERLPVPLHGRDLFGNSNSKTRKGRRVVECNGV